MKLKKLFRHYNGITVPVAVEVKDIPHNLSYNEFGRLYQEYGIIFKDTTQITSKQNINNKKFNKK